MDELDDDDADVDGDRAAGSLLAAADARLPAGAVLLLSDEEPLAASRAEPERALAAALAELARAAAAEARGAEAASLPLRLHERTAPAPAAWRLAAALQAAGARALMPGAERQLQVRVDNLTDELRARWSDAAAEATPSAAALMLLGALLATLAGSLFAVLAWRRLRRQRGGRDAPLLSAADFTFPVDERRVGDGIETMLSCWLRRLHEFGGPEPEPEPAPAAASGDLLAEPASARRAPSLPSSTCSVNRVAADRRTRYKVRPGLRTETRRSRPAAALLDYLSIIFWLLSLKSISRQ